MGKADNTGTGETQVTPSGFKVPTVAEIAKLKEKYPDLFRVKVKDQAGNEYVALLRKPKIFDQQVAIASETKKKGTYNISIWQNCKLVGDPAIEADDYLYQGALSQLDEICAFAEASVEKL